MFPLGMSGLLEHMFMRNRSITVTKVGCMHAGGSKEDRGGRDGGEEGHEVSRRGGRRHRFH
jgi:hypothetical protein